MAQVILHVDFYQLYQLHSANSSEIVWMTTKLTIESDMRISQKLINCRLVTGWLQRNLCTEAVHFLSFVVKWIGT